MRALRVLGLAEASEDGDVKNLVCEDATTGEQFSVPCDDRLRAGTRGELNRSGQLEFEVESQLRPREIQARIRAGATIEEVASVAGTTTVRVERFAYPVLLERASVVEKAKMARPAIDGITAGTSVAETVGTTLAARGHDADISWDAFKDDEGWVLRLCWTAGRSENRAHWLFHPGPGGGTLSARDEAAAEIVDPALRILRPLRPVRQDAVTAVLLEPSAQARSTEVLVRPNESTGRTGHPAGSKLPAAALSAPSSRPSNGFGDRSAARAERFGKPSEQPRAEYSAGGQPYSGQSVALQNQVERIIEDTITDERIEVSMARSEITLTDTHTPDNTAHSSPAAPTGSISTPPQGASKALATKPARKGQRPAMPSWEDVLLGTRTTSR